MTLDQIYAIINLLIAFSVPQPVVDNVQAILINANIPAITTQATNIIPPQNQGIIQPTTTILATTVKSSPIRIGKAKLNGGTLRRLFPNGAKGTINIGTSNLVFQGETDISDSNYVTYQVDETIVNIHAIDTTQFTNGIHNLSITADDQQGQSDKYSMDLLIMN